MNFIMNYPIPNINLVYFFRDVWVEGSAFRAGSKKKISGSNIHVWTSIEFVVAEVYS